MSTVAVCQVELRLGELAANRAAVLSAIEQAAASGAELAVVPELSDSGYVFSDPAEAARLAEPAVSSATLEGWVEVAGRLGLVVVGGFCEAGEDGRLHNSAALVDTSGVRSVYRKAHLWDREKLFFTPGDEAPPVVETPVGRVAVMICYDVEFPEWVRTAALAGADLVAVPTNEPLALRPEGERPAAYVKAQAAAAANGVYVAIADRCGAERGVSWAGVSSVIGPDGYPVVGPPLEESQTVLVAVLEAARARDKRLGERNDVFGDRRLELYSRGPGI